VEYSIQELVEMAAETQITANIFMQKLKDAVTENNTDEVKKLAVVEFKEKRGLKIPDLFGYGDKAVALQRQLEEMKQSLMAIEQENIALKAEVEQRDMAIKIARKWNAKAWCEVGNAMLWFDVEADVMNESITLRFDEKRSKIPDAAS
jgi:hypothetical protein